MIVGRVSEFDPGAGLGVIVADDGRTYRFHCADIADGTRMIDAGASVAFEVVPKLGDLEARCVHKL
jgi:cold shock CspA family protein